MYNLTKIKPLAIAAIVLVIILLTIISVAIFSKGKKAPLPVEYKPSPPPLNPVKLPQRSGFKDELAKIKSILPYKGQNYSIEYLEPVNIISVKIDAASETEFMKAKKQAEEFIRSKGVQDLCTLNIFWVSTKVKVNAKELITTNCPSILKR